MFYSSLLTSIILILAGLVVKNNPELIAGYNTLSKDEKETVDTDKLTQIARKYLVSIGIIVLIAGGLLSLLNVAEKTYLYVICGIVLFGVVVLIIQLNLLKAKQ